MLGGITNTIPSVLLFSSLFPNYRKTTYLVNIALIFDGPCRNLAVVTLVNYKRNLNELN